MKQTIFENKQRADELMREAVRIWRESDHGDQLEGIEQDPVFSLLMTALAYQSNETESFLEQMKSDVLNDFARMLSPYEVGHAIPATAVIETSLQSGLSDLEVNEQHVFTLPDTDARFISLLQTRVLNAAIRSVVRMDGRRWKVTLKFDSPITDLSGFCFAIRNQNFKNLRLYIKGQLLPLVSPWDFSELPLMPCFSIDSILYNRSQTYRASVSCLDLFARQNIRLYYIKKHQGSRYIPSETDSIDLVFEFTGIKDGFLFDRNNLSLNSMILVNANIHTVDISATTPIVRVTGFQSPSSENDGVSQQFLHMMRPSTDQIYGKMPIEVRKVAADRFNQGSLVSLLNTLISRYYTDFYAFSNLREEASDKVMQNLIDILIRMRDSARADLEQRVPGVYLLLRPEADKQNLPASISVSYVTTLGSAVNSQLTSESIFQVPNGFDNAVTRQIGAPVPGSDEMVDRIEESSMTRYYMTTNDRLVTPADLKLFCYAELQARYGITRSMIKQVTVSHRHQQERSEVGYEILVEIVLNDNAFIRRGFEEKIPQTEALMRAMMSVRSTNIYPIQVTIQIDKQNQ
ncbi:MAG: hypothetical protein IJ084_05605 [Prevotella sp.]|nr:hypothetical protein [Prevotella sp.]